MPNVELTIGSKNYNVACDDGEEAHIKTLASSLNVRVEAIAKSFGSASDSLILAITALMMEDEIKNMRAGNNNSPAKQASAASAPVIDEKAQQEKINKAVLSIIEPITEYVEDLAKRLEK